MSINVEPRVWFLLSFCHRTFCFLAHVAKGQDFEPSRQGGLQKMKLTKRI